MIELWRQKDGHSQKVLYSGHCNYIVFSYRASLLGVAIVFRCHHRRHHTRKSRCAATIPMGGGDGRRALSKRIRLRRACRRYSAHRRRATGTSRRRGTQLTSGRANAPLAPPADRLSTVRRQMRMISISRWRSRWRVRLLAAAVYGARCDIKSGLMFYGCNVLYAWRTICCRALISAPNHIRHVAVRWWRRPLAKMSGADCRLLLYASVLTKTLHVATLFMVFFRSMRNCCCHCARRMRLSTPSSSKRGCVNGHEIDMPCNRRGTSVHFL